jgi:hypothetical protein
MKTYVAVIAGIVAIVGGLFSIANNITILENSRSLLYVIAVGYLLTAGGVVWLAFTAEKLNEGLRKSSLVVLCALSVPLFYWMGGWTEPTFEENFCQEYGITITEPPGGYVLLDGQVTIRGSITKKPPDNSIQVIGVAEQQYYPYTLQYVEVTETSWRGRVYGTGDFSAIIAFVGPNSRILFDYFAKAGDENNNWPGIEVLPDDVIECASVYVSAP